MKNAIPKIYIKLQIKNYKTYNILSPFENYIFYTQLIKMKLQQRQLSFEVKLESVYQLEKTIEIWSYIYNYRLMFILAIPATHETKFSQYEIKSMPKLISKNHSLFLTIIPRLRAIIKSKINYAYDPISCKTITTIFSCQNRNVKT